MLACCTDSSKIIDICHFAIEWLPEWIAGRSFTRKCNHLYCNDKWFQILAIGGAHDYITLSDNKTHTFFLLGRLLPYATKSLNAVSSLASYSVISDGPVSQFAKSVKHDTCFPRLLLKIPRIVKRANEQVCKCVSFDDTRTLLRQNHF